MTDAIDVRGLNKSFGDKHVVRDVSIRVGEGKITGFLGPNGAGKTTTLRLLCGLLTPDSGEGEVLGLDFRSQTDAIKRQTGYMTQAFSLYQDMTIEENLAFIARVYGLDNRRQRVTKVLLPSAGPQIFAGLQVSLQVAFVVMIASEMLGSTEGIGALTLLAQQSFAVTDMWSGIVLLGLLGYLVNLLFLLARGRVLHWYDGARKAAKE